MTKQISVIESELYVHSCNRCKYEWVGRLKTPKTCANSKCRTPYWNKPCIRKQNKIKPSTKKFYFYFEREHTSKSYFF